MKKQFSFQSFLTVSLLPLFMWVFLVSGAKATDGIAAIQIENRTDTDNSFSCDVKLSGGQIKGTVYAVLFAQSEQVRNVCEYPAAETVKIALQDVIETDYVKILWTDDKHMPLAVPALLRMSANDTAAYDRFAEELFSLTLHENTVGAAAGSDNPYALSRLLVSSNALPDLSKYQVKIVSGPDNFHVLQFDDPAEAERCEKYLSSCPSVRYVEPDVVFQVDAKPKIEPAHLQSFSEHHSWGVSKTGIDKYAENLKVNGMDRPVIVAVVDSGVDADHPFLQGRLVEGEDFVRKGALHEHGTHVAGTIVDCTLDNENIKIMSVRVLNAFGSGDISNIANGIEYAANHGADIINLSLGTGFESPTIDDAVNYAISKNVTVVTAACNYNGDARNCSPARLEECITVAAVDQNLKRYGKSNYGSVVDISAPGVDIESCLPDGEYGIESGTSMATPHVSAAAALLMSEFGTGQTPFQISSLIRNAAEEIPIDTDDWEWERYRQRYGDANFLGAGFLNMRPFVKHTVTFDANGGTGTMNPLNVSYIETVILPSNAFQRTGYVFDHWNTKADNSGMSYADKASVSVNENMTLYAQWRNTPSPVPEKPLSWGTTATHMDEYAALLQERGNLPEVIVAEIGTGVDLNHPFLQGRLTDGYDFVQYDDIPQDENGHSTHMAGIIVDCTPDNVKIMPVRVLNAFASGGYLNIANGIRYAVDHGADVICAGLATSLHSATLDDAIQYAVDHGVTVVVAAGNYNGNTGSICPAHMEECIVVSVVDKNLERYELSNYGESVDIAAPGVNINSCMLDGKYGEMSGASPATAYASAAAALVLSEKNDLTPAEVEDALKNAASDLGEPGWDQYYGVGFLDMTAFIEEDQVLYAILYADGEMVFQNSPALDPGRAILHEPYPISAVSAQYAEWYALRDRIRTVTFVDKIQPVSTALWFYGCENLSEIRGMENLDTSKVQNMSQMFARCKSLKTLDLSGLDTKNVSSMRQMFFQCGSLDTVYASDTFSVAKLTDSYDMFTGCTSLVGGSGTKYDADHVNQEYANIDDGVYAPGYFSDKTKLLFDGVKFSYQVTNTEPADGEISIAVTANDTCAMGDTLIVSATISTPDAYETGSRKYIGYFAYENRGKWEWQQLRAWYIDGGTSIYTLEIPVRSCPRMGNNTFTVSVFPVNNFRTGASLLDHLFYVKMTQRQ